MEAILKTATWNEFPGDFRMGFRLFRTPLIGWLLIVVMNVFVNQIVPKAIVRNLSDREKESYREPFRRLKDRRPVWKWPNEIPIDGSPPDVSALVDEYSTWLQNSGIPKLLIFAYPGGIINSRMVLWCKDNLKNLKLADIGRGINYQQEDNPNIIGAEPAAWYSGLQ